MEKRISQFHGGTFIQYQGQLHFIVINTMCELLLSIILSTWLNYIAFVHKCVVGRPFLPKGPAANKMCCFQWHICSTKVQQDHTYTCNTPGVPTCFKLFYGCGYQVTNLSHSDGFRVIEKTCRHNLSVSMQCQWSYIAVNTRHSHCHVYACPVRYWRTLCTYSVGSGSGHETNANVPQTTDASGEYRFGSVATQWTFV